MIALRLTMDARNTEKEAPSIQHRTISMDPKLKTGL